MTTKLHHINCGLMHAPPHGRAICHCLLLEWPEGLALVDSGIGLLDVERPLERWGQELLDLVGLVLDESQTAVRRIEGLGLRPQDVKHVVLTHADPDHVGGLADFPGATVHVSEEELANVLGGNRRYLPSQFVHGPRWNAIAGPGRDWFGLEARPLALGTGTEALLVPLFGHTLGHCGVALWEGDRWTLHVGDAYYLRDELETDDHPVSLLAAQRADDDRQRRATLEGLRKLAREHRDLVEMFGYHDPNELPDDARP